MQRVAYKRSGVRELTHARSKVLGISLRMIVMVSISISVGFLVLIMGLWTLSIQRQNEYLRTKINEMRYVLQSVENYTLEELSRFETIVLDEK